MLFAEEFYFLLLDVPIPLRRGYPWGDLSGMWFIAPTATVLFAIGMLIIRGALLWYVAA